MKYSKISIALKDREISVYLSPNEARDLLDQFYEVFSGELTDNCVEIRSHEEHGLSETILVKADQVLYVKVQSGGEDV
ncbi:MAG: hypothetical protein NWE83_07445 [Candidatus Bathyarchaeota archaeon]|nr:hypothetical protein [Candidatus Bathyarchaeota archaeon]